MSLWIIKLVLNGYQYCQFYLLKQFIYSMCIIQIKMINQYFFPGPTGQITQTVLMSLNNMSNALVGLTSSYGLLQMYAISFERCIFLSKSIPQEDYEKETTQSIVYEGSSEFQFENASYTYNHMIKNVLNGLNFKIDRKEKIGVVGRTGAGKSSIIMAITDFLIQSNGNTYIQGKNSRNYSIKDLRELFSIIPQEAFIYEGTLGENLDPMNKYSISQMELVCTECQLFKMSSLSKRLQSMIMVNGSNLSLGEKQLITVAKCILDNKPIILVDEATANLDSECEEIIKQVFQKHFKEKTVITIAHKIGTILESDKILVMKNGAVLEFDRPEELLKNQNTEFYTIVKLVQNHDQL